MSQRDFDPNHFADGISAERWRELQDPDHTPLFNRPIQGEYPPGSTFKIVTALAGLEEGLVSPSETVTCRGSHYFERRAYGCWKRGGHGKVDLHRALVESCDVYFYQLGIELGIERIAAWAERFGLGQITRIDLTSASGGSIEMDGTRPQRRLEAPKTLRMPWFPGETLSASIGQGYVLVTPLQAAVFASVVANGGDPVRPALPLGDRDARRRGGRALRADRRGTPRCRPANLERVRRALTAVVEEKKGTGRRAAVEGVRVAGKRARPSRGHQPGRSTRRTLPGSTGTTPGSSPMPRSRTR